jgi:hypothetical protein
MASRGVAATSLAPVIRQPKRWGRRGPATSPAEPADPALPTPGGPGPDAAVAVIDPAEPAIGVPAAEPVRRPDLWRSLAGSGLGDWLGLLAFLAMAPLLADSSYPSAVFSVAAVFVRPGRTPPAPLRQNRPARRRRPPRP